MTQQKQRKHLILTDNRNIFTDRFKPVEHLQPNFMTDGIRNFMYTKHKGDYVKLRIFYFILQRQRKQTNSVNDSIRILIYTKQPNKQEKPEQPKQRHQLEFHYWQKVYTNETKKTLEYSYSNFAIN